MIKKVIIALLAITMVGADAMGKKKDIVILEEKVAHLNQKVDSLENVILKQRADVSEKITNLFQAYNDLRTSYDKLAQDMKNIQPTANIEIKGDIKCGLALVRSGVLYGYVNAKGEMVVETIYEEAYDFTENYSKVRKDGKWGVIDTVGNVVVPCQYDKVERYESDEILYKVCDSNGLWGLMKPGGVIHECIYSEISKVGGAKDLLRIEKDGKAGIADIRGKIIIPCSKYGGIRKCSYSLDIYAVWDNGGCGLITPTKVLQPCVYEDIDWFSSTLIKFKKNGLWGFFNNKGEIVVPAKYSAVYDPMTYLDDPNGTAYLPNGRYIELDERGNFLKYRD